MPRKNSKPSLEKVEEKPLGLSFFFEEGRNWYRVWNNRWPHDAFEVISPKEFRDLHIMCVRYSIPLEEQHETE